MKTNELIKSENTFSFFEVEIRKDINSGYLNLSDLEEAYTRERIKNGWKQRDINQLLQEEINIERIYYILKFSNFLYVELSVFREQAKSKGIIETLIYYGAYRSISNGTTNTIWIHDRIWILVALEISPVFFARTIKMLREDAFINKTKNVPFSQSLNQALVKFKLNEEQYKRLTRAFNILIYEIQYPGIKNTETIEQQRKLETLDCNIAWAINNGHISSFEMLLDDLKNAW